MSCYYYYLPDVVKIPGVKNKKKYKKAKIKCRMARGPVGQLSCKIIIIIITADVIM